VTKRNYKRRITIVDKKLQFSLALTLTAVMAGNAVLYALAIYVLPSTGALERMNAEETRTFFLGTNMVYFALATMILFTVALVLSHRVAGPAFVIERAIRGTITGDFSHRLSLRKRDHLQPLAATVRKWRDHLESTQAEQRRCFADLERCLAEGDMDAAKELVKQVAATVPELQAVEAEESAAPESTPESATA